MQYTPPKSNACYTSCNKLLIRNVDPAVNFQGKRSRQGKLFLCDECVTSMYKMLPSKNKEKI